MPAGPPGPRGIPSGPSMAPGGGAPGAPGVGREKKPSSCSFSKTRYCAFHCDSGLPVMVTRRSSGGGSSSGVAATAAGVGAGDEEEASGELEDEEAASASPPVGEDPLFPSSLFLTLFLCSSVCAILTEAPENLIT